MQHHSGDGGQGGERLCYFVMVLLLINNLIVQCLWLCAQSRCTQWRQKFEVHGIPVGGGGVEKVR